MTEWLQWVALLAAWLLALTGVLARSQRRSMAASVGMVVLAALAQPTLLAVAVLGITAVPLGVLARRVRRAAESAPALEVV